jgi:hypothetical protein
MESIGVNGTLENDEEDNTDPIKMESIGVNGRVENDEEDNTDPIKMESIGFNWRVENHEEIDIADSSILNHHTGSSHSPSSQSLIKNDTEVLITKYDWKNDFDSTIDKGSCVIFVLAISHDEVEFLSKEVRNIQSMLIFPDHGKSLDIVLHLLSQVEEESRRVGSS